MKRSFARTTASLTLFSSGVMPTLTPCCVALLLSAGDDAAFALARCFLVQLIPPFPAQMGETQQTMIVDKLPDLRAYLLLVVMGAPDNLPKHPPFVGNATLDLKHAFRELREAAARFESEIGDERLEIVDALLGAAHERYAQGEKRVGAQLVRDVIGILFPDRFTEEDKKPDGNWATPI